MSDLIVSAGNGKEINLGDPDNSDAIYTGGSRSISADAQAELAKYPALVLIDMKERGGPQTKAYVEVLEGYASTQKVYGCWPALPSRVED